MALLATACLPSRVFGPVDFSAFLRLASICMIDVDLLIPVSARRVMCKITLPPGGQAKGEGSVVRLCMVKPVLRNLSFTPKDADIFFAIHWTVQ